MNSFRSNYTNSYQGTNNPIRISISSKPSRNIDPSSCCGEYIGCSGYNPVYSSYSSDSSKTNNFGSIFSDNGYSITIQR